MKFKLTPYSFKAPMLRLRNQRTFSAQIDANPTNKKSFT
jgi:hypothetical protein